MGTICINKNTKTYKRLSELHNMTVQLGLGANLNIDSIIADVTKHIDESKLNGDLLDDMINQRVFNILAKAIRENQISNTGVLNIFALSSQNILGLFATLFDKDLSKLSAEDIVKHSENIAKYTSQFVNSKGAMASKRYYTDVSNYFRSNFDNKTHTETNQQTSKDNSATLQLIQAVKQAIEPFGNNVFLRDAIAKYFQENPNSIVQASERAAVELEMQEIKAKAIANGTFMKAPNGKPTNLTERQWLHVRTKNFKKWFGDWEKAIEITERVHNIRNRVFEETGLGLGKNNPNAFHTDSNSVYRITGQSQIDDIINSGYVRPKEGTIRGGRSNEVHWAKGEENLLYTDTNRYILETNKNINDSTDALSINDLQAIWRFENGKWVNVINEIKNKYNDSSISVSKVVDENGEPLVVYHGTGSKFTEFSKDKRGKFTGSPSAKKAFFAASNKDNSAHYIPEEVIMKDLDDKYVQLGIRRDNEISSLNKDYTSLLENYAAYLNFTHPPKRRSASIIINKSDESDSKMSLDDYVEQGYEVTAEHRKLYEEGQNVTITKVYKKWDYDIDDAYRMITEDNEFTKEIRQKEVSEYKEKLDNIYEKYRIEYELLFEDTQSDYLLPLFLNIRNPRIDSDDNKGYRADTYWSRINKAIQSNNDGGIIKDTKDPFDTDVYYFFEPNQAKSATNNNGEYSQENNDMQMFIGKKARTQFEQTLRKTRPDMSDEEIQSTLDFLHSLEDNKENSAYIKTAIRWVANSSITLPRDNTKVRQIFDIARKKNLDLQKYRTFGELVTAPEMQSKEKERKDFDPDKARTFSNKHTVTTEGGKVFTVYDVEDTPEGQREVCKAVAAHYETSPWCLSTFTATGEPTDSAERYWKHYNGVSRKIAYLNGKPVAFSSDTSTTVRDEDGNTIEDLEDQLDYVLDPPTKNSVFATDPEIRLREIETLKNKIKELKSRQEAENKDREAWWDLQDTFPRNKLSDFMVTHPIDKRTYAQIAEDLGLSGTDGAIVAISDLMRNGLELTRENVLVQIERNRLNQELNQELTQASLREQFEEIYGMPAEEEYFMTPQGEIYGFVSKNGDIYLDENIITPEHPIHEFTHFWDRIVKQKNPRLWQRGVELMKQTSEWQKVLADSNYGGKWKSMRGMTESKLEFLIASEVHARLVGVDGEALVNKIAAEQGSQGIIAKLKKWILDVWKELKATFSNWSNEDLNKLKLEDFNHMVVRDLIDPSNFSNFAKNTSLTIVPFRSVDQKAAAKGKISNLFIGYGVSGSSTESYAKQSGNRANVGKYTNTDTVFVSINGTTGNLKERTEAQNKTINEALSALNQGATLITDNRKYVSESKYNEGEKKLAVALQNAGAVYSEVTVDGHVLGVWNKQNDVIPNSYEGMITPDAKESKQTKKLGPDTNIQPVEQKTALDLLESLSPEQRRETVGDYFGNLSEHLGFVDSTQSQVENKAVVEYIKEKHPDIINDNAKLSHIFENQNITMREIEELSDDFVNMFIDVLKMVTNSEDLQTYQLMYPDIFTRTVVKHLNRIISENKRFNLSVVPTVIRLIGFNNLAKMTFDGMDAGVFNISSRVQSDRITNILNTIKQQKLEDIIYDMANPRLADVLGIQINTKVKNVESDDESTTDIPRETKLDIDPEDIENNEIEMVEDDENESQIDETTNDVEAFNDPRDTNDQIVKTDSILKKFSKNLTKEVKTAFNLMKKEGVYTKYGNPQYYNYAEVAHKLTPVIHNAKSSEHMMHLIENSDLSFKHNLLELCEDNNFKQKLFSTFCKAENSLFVVNTREDEDGVTTINSSNINSKKTSVFKAADFILTNIKSAIQAKNGVFGLFVPIGGTEVEALNTEDLLVNDVVLSKIKTELTPEFFANMKSLDNKLITVGTEGDEKVRAYVEQHIGMTYYLLNQFGINDVSMVDLLNYLFEATLQKDGSYKINASRIAKFFNRLNLMLNDLSNLQGETSRGSVFDMSHTRVFYTNKLDAKFRKLCEECQKMTTSNREFSTTSGNKTYCTYSNINYISRLQQRLTTENVAESDKFIIDNFARTTFFRPLFDYKLKSWITEMYNDPQRRMDFTFNRFVSFNGQKSHETLDIDYLRVQLEKFGKIRHSEHDSNYIPAEYFLPTMSDKSTNGTIRGPKESMSGILEGLRSVFAQECFRIQDVIARANRKDIVRLKNYDIRLTENGGIPIMQGGVKFSFLPFFNKYLLETTNEDNHHPIVEMLREIIKNPQANIMALFTQNQNNITEVIQKSLEEMFIKDYNTLRNSSSFESLVKQFPPRKTGADFDLFYMMFWYNSFYANTQMYQLLTGDLAFYKNPNDVIKRSSEFISDGLALDETATMFDETGAEVPVKKIKECIVINDTKSACRFSEFSSKVLNQKKLDALNRLNPKNRRIANTQALVQRFDEYEKAFNSYDPTDGQGFTSFKYHYRLLNCLGRSEQMPQKWYAEYMELYNRFAKLYSQPTIDANEKAALLADVRKFNSENKIETQPEKQFTYTQLIDENNVKRSLQIKNSEYPLMDIEQMMTSEDDMLARVAAFMHNNDIDAIYFESNVKVGQSATLNFSDVTPDNINSKLESFIRDDNRTKNTLQIPIGDVLHQQEVPNHAQNHKQALGVQLQREFASFIDDAIKSSEYANEFEKIHARRIERAAKKLMNELGLDKDKTLDFKGKIEFNKKLSKKIREHLKARNELTADNNFRFSIDKNTGDFNIPLNDPMSFKQVDSIIMSMIVDATMEPLMNGGNAVQVTDAFRYSVFNGKHKAEKDDSLKIMYKDKDGNITHDPKKAVSIAYYEAEMPAPYKEMFKHYANTDGTIDMDKVPDELKRVIAYRIPTEGACSVFPIKIVRFSNKVSGGIIKMPAELPAIGGMDYDIDKLYFITPSIYTEYEYVYDEAVKKKVKKIKNIHVVNDETVRTFAKQKDLEDLNDCNKMFDLIYDVLTSEDFVKHHFTPSNFYDLKYEKYLIGSYKNSVTPNMSEDEKANLYNSLLSQPIDSLQKIYDKGRTPVLCSPTFQLNAHTKNLVAKQTIGMFANSNALTMYLQNEHESGDYELFEIGGYSTIAGFSINGSISRYTQDGLTLTKDNISQGVGASADAVKDPTLDELNINDATMPIVDGLLKIGFTHEIIALILQQPIVKVLQLNAVENKNNTGSKYANITDEAASLLTDDILAQEDPNPNEINAVTSARGIYAIPYFGTIHITKEELIKYVGTSYQDMMNDEQVYNDQMNLLRVLWPVLRYNQQTLNDIGTFKFDVQSTLKDKSLLHSVGRINKVLNEKKEGENADKSLGKTHIYQSATSQQELIRAIYGQVNATLQKYSYNSKRAKNFLAAKQEFNEYMLYRFTHDIDGANKTMLLTDKNAKGYAALNDITKAWLEHKMPDTLQKMKDKLLVTDEFKNNAFLKHLTLDIDLATQNPIIVLNSIGMDTYEIQAVKQGYADVMNSSDPHVRNFGLALWLYDLNRVGFNHNSSSYNQFLPAYVLKKIGNYMQFLKNIENDTSSHSGPLRYFDEFKRGGTSAKNQSVQLDTESVNDYLAANDSETESASENPEQYAISTPTEEEIDNMSESKVIELFERTITGNSVAFDVNSLNLSISEKRKMLKEYFKMC